MGETREPEKGLLAISGYYIGFQMERSFFLRVFLFPLSPFERMDGSCLHVCLSGSRYSSFSFRTWNDRRLLAEGLFVLFFSTYS